MQLCLLWGLRQTRMYASRLLLVAARLQKRRSSKPARVLSWVAAGSHGSLGPNAVAAGSWGGKPFLGGPPEGSHGALNFPLFGTTRYSITACCETRDQKSLKQHRPKRLTDAVPYTQTPEDRRPSDPKRSPDGSYRSLVLRPGGVVGSGFGSYEVR